MEITLIQAILIGLWTGFCLSGSLLGIYTQRCLIVSFGIGLILGDITTAIMVGAIGELAFMGFGVSPGGTVPPSSLGPGVFGVLLAVTNKSIDGQTAFSLSIPFAIAIQFIITATYTASSFAPGLANKAIVEGKESRFTLWSHFSFITQFVLGSIIGFIAAVSTESINTLVAMIPQVLTTGLSMAGAMIPAVGFAMILSNMIRKENIAYLILGYVLVAYLKLPLMGVAMVGAFFAMIEYSRSTKSNDNDQDNTETTERLEFGDGI